MAHQSFGYPQTWLIMIVADQLMSTKSFIYGQFYEKARACIEFHKRLSKSNGGHPLLTLDELLAAVLRSMSGCKNIPGGSSIKELNVFWVSSFLPTGLSCSERIQTWKYL